MRMYKVFFRDGNERIFEAKNMLELFGYLFYEIFVPSDTIVRVEELND